MKEKKSFELPESLLNQLNECTLSFCLAYVDQEGNPIILTHCDNQSFFLALQSSLKSWISAHEEVSKDMNIQEMMTPFEESDEEDD